MVCCDINRQWTDVARRYWERAGVADRVELRLGPALDTLDAMLTEGLADTFDFAFLDADKDNYPEYSDRLIALLGSGGLWPSTTSSGAATWPIRRSTTARSARFGA